MPEITNAAANHRQDPFEPAGLAPDLTLVMRVTPMPADANGNGDIFGGWIMAQVDLAGSVLAGDLLSFYAVVRRVGTTSVTVQVEVHAQRNPAAPQIVKVTEASVTYVAIDNSGRPRKLPTT